MTVDLPTYIPLAEAARRYGVSREALTRLVKTGKIRAVKVNGGVVVAQEDLDLAQIQRRIQATAKADDDLRGRPIRVTEAAEKYGVSHANLSRWAQAGYIRIIERRPKLLLLDEADVRRAAEIFKAARTGTGSSVRAGWVLKRIMSGN